MTGIKPTIEVINDLLFIETPVEPVDLLFVFGNDWIETMNEVYSLYQRGIAKNILISGHSVSGNKDQSEALRFLNRGIELGIPKTVFLLEEKATNTKENLEFSSPIIQNSIGFSNIRKIMFVCKTFHTRRVMMTAKQFFPDHIEYLFYPVKDERNIQKDNWWKDQVAFERVIAEVRRIAEYTLKGDLSIS